MKNLTALFLLMLMYASTTLAQNSSSCPSDMLNDSLMNHNMEFSRSFFYMEHVLGMNRNLHPSQRTDEVYTIPVVVHVIHTGESYGTGTNITNEQIFSAIEALNEDFRRMAGTNGFGNGVDVGIEFCLAARNPSGQPTNGIVRVNGSSVANYATMGIEASSGTGAVEESVKALSTWPRTSYLNIWIVNEIENNDGGSGIQGYAYFPVNSPIDGIVLLYNAFGTVGNLKSYTNMNRTLTHEVGHYLGLYHTFNSTSSCSGETNCATQGDRVCDTPPTIQAGSCSSPACSGTQQVENYMDYTSQTCQDMFTDGQKLRMRTTLETQRTSILTSMGCMPVFQNDIGITAIISPTGTNCAGGIVPQVTLANFGGNTLTSAVVQYNINGSGSQSYTWSGSLAPGSSTTVTLPSINPAAGSHTFYAWTGSPNGGTDENAANNQSTGVFAVTAGSAAQLDVVLDYYGTETSWTISDANNVILMNGGPYVNGQQGLHNVTPVCLAEGCYTLTMNDVYGDGQGFTNGSFSLTAADGSILAQGAGNWGDSSVNPFCIVASTPQGQAPVASFTIQDNSICRNVQNDFTSTSTQSPNSFSWSFEGGTPATSTQQNPQNVTYANAGTYDVTLTVSNANGSDTYVCANCVTVYADPIVTLTSTNPGCGAQANGSVTSSVSGTGPYTYNWSNGSTGANLSNVGAGNYTVTVTSAQGCSGQASVTLTNPSGMTLTGNVQNATCAGVANGSITTSVAGGTGNKTYAWSNGATTANISNLAAGSYSVTVTDAAGCTATNTFTITAPSAITISGSATAITCAGLNNGLITVSATGGSGNKVFTWSNGATGSSINNLGAGNYTVTATDANGCTATASYSISAPQAISITGTANAVICFGDNNGSILVNATGGTGNKTFTWNTGAVGAGINNLAAGSYTVTATDAAGCSATQSFTVNSPSALTINSVVSSVSCFGENDGSIVINANGGSGTLSTTWNTGVNGNTLNNAAAGSYVATVTDLAGCQASATFTISEPQALEANLTDFDIACDDLSGSAIVSPAGGTGPYIVNWSNGINGYTNDELAAGNYSVSITDNQGCVITNSFTITQSDNLSVFLQTENISCFGASNGSIEALVSGGDQNYTYEWNNGASSASISNLLSGQYTLTVTDGSGCSGIAQATITQPAQLTAAIDANDITCFGQNNGSALAIVFGGTTPYQYGWSNGSNDEMTEGLSVGSLTLNIVDANGCTAQTSEVIEQPTMLTVNVLITDAETCAGNDGGAEIMIDGGVPAYAISWSNGSNSSILENAASGVYNVVVSDANGCTINASAEILYDCEVTIPPTQLMEQYCNTSDFGMDGTLACEIVEGAEQYMWRVSTPTGTILIDEFTNNNQFNVSGVPGLQYNTTYVIGIKARVNGNWGPFGDYCSVTTETLDLPTTGIVAADCGTTIQAWGETIEAIAIDGVLNYEWHITGNNYDWTAFTADPSLSIVDAMQLTAGETYEVSVRCAYGAGIFTEWSSTCTFTVALELPVVESDASQFTFNLYPNPCNGSAFNVQWVYSENNQENLQVTVHDAAGKIVLSQKLSATNSGNFEVTFNTALSSGFYVVTLENNSKRLEKKLLVN
ncbi:MAG: M43 family zinc metalloprotease [Flavobacteriales bacterium]